MRSVTIIIIKTIIMYDVISKYRNSLPHNTFNTIQRNCSVLCLFYQIHYSARGAQSFTTT